MIHSILGFLKKMSDFYLTLPSNSSLSYFPSNTLTNFRTKLHSPIHLQGKYEVALVEISYPLNFVNLRKQQEDDYKIVLTTDGYMKEYPPNKDPSCEIRVPGWEEIFQVPQMRYSTLEELLTKINEGILFSFGIQFSFLTESQRVGLREVSAGSASLSVI